MGLYYIWVDDIIQEVSVKLYFDITISLQKEKVRLKCLSTCGPRGAAGLHILVPFVLYGFYDSCKSI